ncbi:MAG: polyamine aminopropyltransferase [Ruminococcus sp.]|jgi:spermidine synthase|nr:polyamine aminopropyltransferase [Ruminococcus sp.]
MEIWFSECHTPDVKLSIRIDRHLHSEESEFQRIDVFDSPEFGRFLTLDGFMMLTEKDEFIYHEMITHVAMASNPAIKKVLVIGAGDGGTIRELVRYPHIWHIDVAEIDERVVSVCKEYLEQTASGFYDNRVHIHFEDGLKYVRSKENFYDLIIVDSTDPFGPGEGLFTAEFYGNCENALTENGILINQHESPYYPDDAKSAIRAHKRIKSAFKTALVYQAHIPTYPSGHWLFGFASKGNINPFDFDKKAWEALNIKTKYYNTDIHTGAFALPTYVKELLES